MSMSMITIMDGLGHVLHVCINEYTKSCTEGNEGAASAFRNAILKSVIYQMIMLLLELMPH
jgi:hypothetical protein